ncbi:YdiU family protein [Pseudoteredinibacter isoporae]
MSAILEDQTALQQLASGHGQGLAMKYSGHQFGVFNPQLGDGRGLLLGEWKDSRGELWDWHLKGAGRTPFSRFGDGRAVWRSSVREHIIGESLNALGIASSRSLCLLSSNEEVMRETPEYAASIIRIAKTHIRFGSFEEFFYQRKYQQLRELADYCIERYLPHNSPGDYQSLLDMAVINTADMIAAWQVYGFNHGVMNTDNMSIIGETFDFGPYAFLDDYEPEFICNHSDTHGRYRFSQQPSIGLWNLNALAHALSILLDQDQLKSSLMNYQKQLANTYQSGLNRRLGIQGLNEDDVALSQRWLSLLAAHNLDYNLSFRALADVLRGIGWQDSFTVLADSEDGKIWLCDYHTRIENQSPEQTAAQMDDCNPLYLPRSHHLQQVIEASMQGDDLPLERLFDCVSSPFAKQQNDYGFDLAPASDEKGICLSCSS